MRVYAQEGLPSPRPRARKRVQTDTHSGTDAPATEPPRAGGIIPENGKPRGPRRKGAGSGEAGVQEQAQRTESRLLTPQLWHGPSHCRLPGHTENVALP